MNQNLEKTQIDQEDLLVGETHTEEETHVEVAHTEEETHVEVAHTEEAQEEDLTEGETHVEVAHMEEAQEAHLEEDLDNEVRSVETHVAEILEEVLTEETQIGTNN